MSDELFPELPGLEWELTKTPIFNTKIMTSVNGRELRASYQAVPKYEFTMSYAFLRENKGRKELQTLESFFADRRGAFDSFLFKAPEDNAFNCNFVGDGSASVFQLYKLNGSKPMQIGNTATSYQAADPNMWNQVVSKPMWDTNVEKPMWNQATKTVNKDGQLVLSQPLEAGVGISITGTYFYRCRFKDDEQQYTHFMTKLWKASKVELVGSLGKKI
ncbi:DUF2460 domain-containing protein [Acinetobacter wuhouensis]|uniref:DUF2460 domain-containing protein n=1 Tax=Acinetobacter wuhouensis TaxID=1879050 RepID=A0A4Q7ALB3_9GAMM|nr:DUF2460 domain-containing protein [Acinetobacter wuhouensis]RZG48062.1 hypothetical protein EXU28_04650 [Acinetobacter wuhouensis]